MIQLLSRKIFVAGIALLTVPATLLAQQQEKAKAKDHQQIIITRTGDTDEKVTIEIEGDKVKVNGKNDDANNDVTVRINKIKAGAGTLRYRAPGAHAFTVEGLHPTLYSVDSNRAMLGVVTEGKENGAAIVSVTKGSGAEKAGLKKGDIITSIGKKKIETTDDVTAAIRSHKPGEKVNITVLRDGKEQKLTAELGRWKGINVTTFSAPRILDGQIYRESIEEGLKGMEEGLRGLRVPGFEFEGGSVVFNNRPKLGLSIQDTEEGKGVKILEVEEGSNAAKAGLKNNDIITHIDDEEVNNTDTVRRLTTRSTQQNQIKMKILRDGKPQTVDVRIPTKIKTIDI